MSGPFGDLRRLMQHLDARVLQHPDYADLRNLRGLGHAYGGDLDAAHEDLDAALQRNPLYSAAQLNLAWLHLQRGDLRAWSAWREGPGAGQLPPAWLQHVDLCAVLHRDGALSALHDMDARDDWNAATGAWRVLDRLWLLVQLERWSDVALHLERLQASDATWTDIFSGIGVLSGGRPSPVALQLWAASYRGNPLGGAALCHRSADVALHTGAVGQAHGLLLWGAALSLDLCAYEVQLASTLQVQGDEAGALAALRRAAEVDPDRVEARVALGYLCAALGMMREAMLELERAVQLAPRYADVRYQLALLCAEAGIAPQAEQHLRAALELQPDYVPARLALGYLLTTQGRDAEALQLLQSVRHTGLRSADLELRLALLHDRLGHPIQARRARARARASKRSAGSSQG